jgi:hypothetical protein
VTAQQEDWEIPNLEAEIAAALRKNKRYRAVRDLVVVVVATVGIAAAFVLAMIWLYS